MTPGKLRRRDGIHRSIAAGGVRLHVHSLASDLLDGALGTVVLEADEEENAIHPLKGMLQHQALHLAVVLSAPVSARQKCPTDFDLAFHIVVAMKSRRADHTSAASIQGNEGP